MLKESRQQQKGGETVVSAKTCGISSITGLNMMLSRNYTGTERVKHILNNYLLFGYKGAKGDWDFRISVLARNTNGTDI